MVSRGSMEPDISRKLYELIMASNTIIFAYESAGRERVKITTQLSEWGKQTGRNEDIRAFAKVF